MNWDQLELHPRVRAAARRARLKSVREVLCVSGLDLQRLTGLSHQDTQQLLAAAAAACRPHRPVSALLLHRGECRRLEPGLRLSVGCPVLDELLRGGLPVGGITELSGESGAGKTQLALQLCLSVQYPTQYRGLESGAVYICTEDLFPIRRLQQLIRQQSCLRSDVPQSLIHSLQFSDRVYVEHAADLAAAGGLLTPVTCLSFQDSLQVCLSRRVPLLLARGLVRLLVVDSVAALFRSEFQADDWLERNKQLLTFSSTLRHLSQEFSTAVLCVNQVTDVFNRGDPSLGTVARGDQSSALRRLDVVFAPHLARDGRDAAVWREGLRGGAVTMTPSTPLPLLLLLLLSAASTLSSSTEDLTNKNSDFAAGLYRMVASQTDENVLLSPFTLSTGLMALLSATTGLTQDQLLHGLSLAGLDPQTLPDLFQALRTAVLQGGGNLQQGVALFPTQSFQVSPSYLDLIQAKFGGQAKNVAYTVPQEAIDTINRWAQEQTSDQVRELVTNLDPQTQLLLATAASYQTQFTPSFNTSLSQDERFYVDKYHVAMVTMMFRADKYFLAYDRSVKAGVLKLPMTDGAAMLVVLPDEDVDISSVEEEVTAEKIQAWIKQLKKTKLEVQLPRFMLERSYSLKDVLQTLNITQVFQNDADITNMGGTKGPSLTQILQKSTITVDERSDDSTAGVESVCSPLFPHD
ncbi:hypothetical protein INR49_006860 [Caranx melampygus]|nr:hypothetical protein INR49_006860 [Caranx melampygus]